LAKAPQCAELFTLKEDMAQRPSGPKGAEMVNLYVGITDYDWFRFLSAQPSVEEVNFWQPGGRTNFKALQPGELFLFKLHSPRNFIVGGGVFAHADNPRMRRLLRGPANIISSQPITGYRRRVVRWQARGAEVV
jgi:putative restriction endonuclease